MTTRAEVVAEAQSWKATPYHHQGRVKGVGVDCAGLPICVARNLGLVAADFDINGYSRQPDGHSLLEHCRAHLVEIAVADIQPGDVVAQYLEADPCHLAIVGDYRGGLSLIHALTTRAGGGRVLEHRLDPTNRSRIVAAFQFPGIE